MELLPTHQSPRDMLKKEEVACSCQIPKFLKSAATKGGIGLLASAVLNIIHPLSGAIFASSQSIMQQLLWPGVQELLAEEEILPTKVYVYVVTFMFSAIVAISMTLSLGFPMNFPAAIWLSIAMIPVSLLVDYLFRNMIVSEKKKYTKTT